MCGGLPSIRTLYSSYVNVFHVSYMRLCCSYLAKMCVCCTYTLEIYPFLVHRTSHIYIMFIDLFGMVHTQHTHFTFQMNMREASINNCWLFDGFYFIEIIMVVWWLVSCGSHIACDISDFYATLNSLSFPSLSLFVASFYLCVAFASIFHVIYMYVCLACSFVRLFIFTRNTYTDQSVKRKTKKYFMMDIIQLFKQCFAIRESEKRAYGVLPGKKDGGVCVCVHFFYFHHS